MSFLNPTSESARQKKSSFHMPKGTPQLAALVLLLIVNSLIADNFFSIHIQDGRLFGSTIDILNRGAPVALLTVGMTLVGLTSPLAR
ncbi:MAG: hypothetical protein ACTMIA_04590 [Vibrio sp.]